MMWCHFVLRKRFSTTKSTKFTKLEYNLIYNFVLAFVFFVSFVVIPEFPV
jgi:hypothetical protein